MTAVFTFVGRLLLMFFVVVVVAVAVVVAVVVVVVVVAVVVVVGCFCYCCLFPVSTVVLCAGFSLFGCLRFALWL